MLGVLSFFLWADGTLYPVLGRAQLDVNDRYAGDGAYTTAKMQQVNDIDQKQS